MPIEQKTILLENTPIRDLESNSQEVQTQQTPTPSKPEKPRIPPPYADIQYNCCKNPKCENYGIPAENSVVKGRGSPENKNRYTVSGTGRGGSSLKCNSCGEYPSIKSNIGISQEIERLLKYIKPKNLCCPKEDCKNHLIPIGTKKAYRSYGKNSSGTPRYKCNECGGTFSEMKNNAYINTKETHYNRDIFSLLVNKMPLNRIISHKNISWSVLYNRIDFIHKQCMAFVAHRERALKDLPIEKVYIAVDRQEYVINWTEREDRRNISIHAIASADNESGYVFAMNPNFDEEANSQIIEQECSVNGDNELGVAYRKNARFWIAKDYEQSIKRSYKRKFNGADVSTQIEQTYSEAINRNDIEASDELTVNSKLPKNGMLVHSDYTMIAHFYLLKELLGQVKKWRFYLDQESGIRSAVLYTFQDEIRNKMCEAFYVSIEKGLSIDEKKQLKAQANARHKKFAKANPLMNGHDVKIELWKENLQQIDEQGKWKDKWVYHPCSELNEPNKKVCWLTEHEEFDEDHVANIYDKASLHSADVFFEKVRRRNSQLERPLHSSSNEGKVWNGYGFYNPAQVKKLLDILRVVHNYVDTRRERENGDKDLPMIESTPATRIGLAKAPLDFDDILRFDC